MWAISGTSGSSGLGSQSREQIDRRKSAGLQMKKSFIFAFRLLGENASKVDAIFLYPGDSSEHHRTADG